MKKIKYREIKKIKKYNILYINIRNPVVTYN